MESGRILLKENLLPYLRRRSFYMEAVSVLLALLFGRIEIFDGLLPFGIALLAAMDMAGFNVYYPFAGALLSALFLLPAGATALTACAVYMVLRSGYLVIRKKITRIDKLLLLTLSQLLLLPLFYLETIAGFLQGMAGLALTMLFCICFQNGLRALKRVSIKQKLQEEEQVAICLLFGAFSLAVTDVAGYTFSLGVMCIAWAAIFMAYAKGLSAVAASVALAGMLVLGGKVHPLLLADMAACTLIGVLCRRIKGTWGVGAGFLVCCAITEKYFGIAGQHIGLLNAAPAALIFAILPRKSVLWLRALIDTSAREERTAFSILKRMQSRAAEDIQETALTVDRMAMLFPAKADWSYTALQERAEMQQAAYSLCTDCTHRVACWRDPVKTMAVIESMLPAYHAGLRLRPQLPLDNDCTHTTAIAAAAAHAQEAYHKHCMLAYRQDEQQAFAHRQLAGIGHVMKSLSEDLRERIWPDEGASVVLRRRLEREGIPLRAVLAQRSKSAFYIELRLQITSLTDEALIDAVSRAAEQPMRILRSQEYTRQRIIHFEQASKLTPKTGTSTRPMPGSAVSGDSTGGISLQNGRAMFALSDGMGSGSAAKKQSEEAVQLLLKLYEVGFERDTALECVNRLLINQGAGDMYATVDALHVNLNTGEAEFIKFGAPPSFVLREGKVHTIYAEALPAGILDEASPAVNIATLRRNDVAVLLTDGALDALKEDTTEEIIRCIGGANSCKEAADELLRAAYERGAQDDMTVLVVRME